MDAGGGPPRDPELGRGWKLGGEATQPSVGNSAGNSLAGCPKLALGFESVSLEGGSDLTVATNAIQAGDSKTCDAHTHSLSSWLDFCACQAGSPSLVSRFLS